MYWTARRNERSLAPRKVARSTPSNTTRPALGFSSPTMVLPNVDLPQPDSPTRPTNSPLWMTRSIPSHARMREPGTVPANVVVSFLDLEHYFHDAALSTTCPNFNGHADMCPADPSLTSARGGRCKATRIDRELAAWGEGAALGPATQVGRRARQAAEAGTDRRGGIRDRMSAAPACRDVAERSAQLPRHQFRPCARHTLQGRRPPCRPRRRCHAVIRTMPMPSLRCRSFSRSRICA